MNISTKKEQIEPFSGCSFINPSQEIRNRLAGKKPEQRGPARFGSIKRWFGEIFYPQYAACLKHGVELGLYPTGRQSRRIPRPDYISLENPDLKTIYLYKKSGTEFYADYIVSADIFFHENASGQTDCTSQWFRIRTICDLNPRARSFNELSFIRIYDKYEPVPGFPLNEYLIPYISKEMLNWYGDETLYRHDCGSSLCQPRRLRGTELAKSMKLNILHCHLPRKDIRAQIYFEKHSLQITEDGKEKTVRIPGNTIVINPDACCDARGLVIPEKINEAIVHECLHYDWHQLFYLGQKLYNENFCCISCTQSGMQISEKIDAVYQKAQSPDPDDALEAQSRVFSPIDLAEWQAAKLTPCVLMPGSMAISKIDALYAELKKRYPEKRPIEITGQVVLKLADFFGVSRQMAKLRMIDLGYPEALGVLNYVNNRYVPPYSFQAGAITKGQTFTLSLEQLLDLYEESRDFRQVMDSGRYIYADGFVCLMDARYIRFDEPQIGEPSVHLTEYALGHTDECCLVFSFKRGSRPARCPDDTFHWEEPDGETKLAFEKKYNALIREADRNFIKAEEQARKFKLDLYPLNWEDLSFSEALCQLMLWRNLSVESIVAKTGLKRHKIIGYRNQHAADSPTIEELIAICIALSLPISLQEDLFQKAGRAFTRSLPHMVYKMLLGRVTYGSMEDFNQALVIIHGLPPIPFDSDEADVGRKRYERIHAN